MNDATPWIDPELVAAGKLLQSRGLVAPDRTQASLSEVRAAVDRIGAFLGEGSVPLARERDLALPGPHGQVPCRLYLPDDADPRTAGPGGPFRGPPLIIYAHGGGFVQGSLPSWDAMLRDLVRQSGVAALSVDYRLSPEHRFPVALDEMVAMIRLAAREGAGLGIDPSRLAVGGDSAGANLALAAALALRDAAEPWIWETYLKRPEQRNDWRAVPILADPAGLPPAHLIVGSLDPLLDDSHALAARLTTAGVPCELTVYDGLNHGFIRYGRLIAAARRAFNDCAAALRKGLA